MVPVVSLMAAGVGVSSTIKAQEPQISAAKRDELIKAKEAQRAAAGLVKPSASNAAPVIDGPQPSSNYTVRVHLSKAELLERLDRSAAAAEEQFAEVERLSGPDVARKARENFQKRQVELRKAVPEEGEYIEVQMVHVGQP